MSASIHDASDWHLLPCAMLEIDFSSVMAWMESLPVQDSTQFKTLLRTHPDAVRQAMSALRVIRATEEAQHLLDIDHEQEVIRDAGWLFTEELKVDYLRVIIAAYKRQPLVVSNTSIRTRSGEPVDVTLRWQFVANVDYRYTRAFVMLETIAVRVFRDVDEVDFASEELILPNASSSNDEVRILLHEINNPLTYVLGHLTELHGDPEISSRAKERVREALDGARRIADLVKPSSQTTVVTADDALPARRLAGTGVVSVHDVLEDALRIASPHYADRASIVRQYALEPLLIDGNGARLTQVFVNLIVNAAQALEGRGARPHMITLRTMSMDNGAACIEVQDTGTGIAPQVEGRVFEIDVTTKPTGVGSGLGLAICKGIVEDFGGGIELRNAPSGGAIASVILPLSANACLTTAPTGSQVPTVVPSIAPTADHRSVRAVRAATSDSIDSSSDLWAPTQSAIRPRSMTRLRVLVIDDELAIGRLITKGMMHHHVTFACGGREGLHHLLRTQFDAILCDLTLNDIDGEDLYRIARTQASPSHERFIFMSGGLDAPERLEFLRELPNHRIHKPFDLRDLDHAIRRVAQASEEYTYELTRRVASAH